MAGNNNNNDNYINIILTVSQEEGKETKLHLKVERNEKMSSVITKFINKMNVYDPYIFIFNGQRLDETLTVSEQGINDGSNIYAVKLNDRMGA